MPSNSADYQREYRKRHRAAPNDAASPQVDPDTGEVARPERIGYGCGCWPGEPCMGHGVARMSQAGRDAVLAAINHPSPR